jgi:hypothetical protein
MKRTLVLLAGCTLLAWSAYAQEQKMPQEPQEKASANASGSASTSAQAGQNSASLSQDTTIQASLSQSLDARKNKQGDKVEARTTEAVKQDGQVVLPKGTRLVGHVTQAKARAKGESESALGVAFDRAILKNGQEMPINVVIQAVAAAQSAASLSAAETDLGGQAGGMASGQASASRGGGGLVGTAGSAVGGATSTVASTTGAVGSTVGATANTATSAAGSAAGHSVAGALSSSTSGVIGLQGLALNSQAASATQGSVITSSTKNVHLDSGTRLLLRAQAQ